MPKSTIDIELKVTGQDSVADVERKTKSLRTQLFQIKEELAKGDISSGRFSQLSTEAAEITNRIKDVNKEVKNLSSDTQKLDGIVSVTQGIVGGFAAVQGITALVGDENKELQQTMMKLQGAMTAMMGIQQVANTLNKSSAATSLVQSARLKILTYLQKQHAIATSGATMATRGLAMAGQALGIGLIIAAIALLINYFDDIKKVVTKFIPSLEQLAYWFEKVKNIVTDFLGITSDQTRAYDTLVKSTEKVIKAQEDELEIMKIRGATAEEIWKREKEIIDLRLGLLRESVKLNGKLSKEEQEQADALQRQKIILNETYYKSADDERKKDAEKRSTDNKKKADEQKKKKEADKKASEQEMADMMEALMNENAADDRQEEWQKKREAERVAQLEVDRVVKEKADADALAIQNELNAQKLQAEIDLRNAKVSIVNDSYNILNNLGQLALGNEFKNTAAGKVIALSQIATDTALAISALTRNSQANPLNAPTSGLAGAAQFASGLAMITANVAKAKGILSGGGASGGSSAPSMGGGSTQTQQTNPPINIFRPTNKDQSMKVVVLENDITDTVDRVARIRANATLG
jgi:hypothetical protein